MQTLITREKKLISFYRKFQNSSKKKKLSPLHFQLTNKNNTVCGSRQHDQRIHGTEFTTRNISKMPGQCEFQLSSQKVPNEHHFGTTDRDILFIAIPTAPEEVHIRVVELGEKYSFAATLIWPRERLHIPSFHRFVG